MNTKRTEVGAFGLKFWRVKIKTSSEAFLLTRLQFELMTQPVQKNFSLFLRSGLLATFALLIIGFASVLSSAQTEDAFGDAGADPVKLFERGQNAHARGDFQKAIEYYDEAIKVRPEFAEAEFQRATALVSIERFANAEAGFRRAIELRKNWSLPYSSFGALLVRLNRDAEAEALLRQAIKLEPEDSLALRMLAEVRLRANDPREALQLAQRATLDKQGPASTWVLKAIAERLNGNSTAALASLEQALQLDSKNPAALMERAELRINMREMELAVADLRLAESVIKSDKAYTARLAKAYEAAGKTEDAHRLDRSSGLVKQNIGSPADQTKVVGTPEEIEAANSDDQEVARKALLSLLEKNPENAMLMARLGASFRTIDPARSLDFYLRANKKQPGNADYAAGYGAALVQSKRYAEAAGVLRRVVSAAPDNYVAHANLATALNQLKQFQLALVEYEWLLKAKPDLAIVHYFIASAHDNLGEYEAALTAYELFMAHADVSVNQLEIEKVKLRLPSLKRQIKLGQGVKRKPEPPTER